MTKWLPATLIAVALSALLLAGCGGSQSAQTGTAPQPAVTDSSGTGAAPAADNGATQADVPTLTPVATPTVPSAPPTTLGVNAKVLFKANFGSGSLDGWTFLNLGIVDEPTASWIIQDGRLVQNGDSLGRPADFETVAKAGSDKWQNYTYTAQLLSTGGDLLGVTFRHSDAGFYRVVLAAKAPNSVAKLSLEKVVDGHATVIAEDASWPGYDTNKWYAISVSVVGTGIKVSVAGQQVFDVKDSSLSQGAIGLYAVANGGASFNNVAVTEN
jgi:hypothetical protein